MSPNTASARFLLATTLLLALAGDILLRAHPWGVNFSLSALLLFAGIGILAHRLRDPIPRDAWTILGFGLILAACFSWRDSTDLAAFNFLATLAAAGLVTARKREGEIPRMTFVDHLHQSLVHTIHTTVGFGFLLLRDVRASEGQPRDTRWGRAWLGVALAIPAILVFGSLLASADAAFEYLVEEVLQIDFWTLIGHMFLIAFLSWTVGGFLRGRFFATEIALPPDLRPKRLTLGILEIAIVLGALDLLFGTFVAVQLPYFFGGHGTVLGTPSLTYAEYARRGFFELITVALLSLPLLLIAEWLLRTEQPRELRLFRALSIVMVTLVGVMLASGMHRLWLYMDAYGLTTARVHAAAILLWIGVTLLLFCVTVLRGQRDRLPFGIAVSGFIVLIGLNAVNPDALVARVNLDRMASDGTFDPHYTFSLSADAAPVLLDAIAGMKPEIRSALAQQMLNRYVLGPSGQDLRSWNAARATARALAREREGTLREYLLPTRKPAPECR